MEKHARSEEKSESYWKNKLSPEQYAVLREAATEPPFSGRYVKETADGIYKCAACGAELFSSKTKFDSKCGWPSFYDSLGTVGLKQDLGHDMDRIEVVCRRCRSHLGHVFDDGPKLTGQRYCINSLALEFKEKE